jgi:hypothetical protein
MKFTHGLEAARKRIVKALHLDEVEGSYHFAPTAGGTADLEWVIVYRTAQGFCCVYHGEPVDFAEMLDVQIWSEEMDVQTYYMGL